MSLAPSGLGVSGGAPQGGGGFLSGLGGLASRGIDAFLKEGSFSFQNDSFSVGFDPQKRRRKELIDELLRMLMQPKQGTGVGESLTVGGNQTQSAITPIPSFNTGFGSSGGPFGLGGLRNLLGQ